MAERRLTAARLKKKFQWTPYSVTWEYIVPFYYNGTTARIGGNKVMILVNVAGYLCIRAIVPHDGSLSAKAHRDEPAPV